ncbi:hypothetical protein [Cupriavidus sp. TA19]|uniref:COG3014 family protein n=1 Tax=Cupriavidus sp. TA19 TaxID=701108 RepID=UPI00295F4DBC|nr:hypothetical protein [Cupriavidus sp. TA19]
MWGATLRTTALVCGATLLGACAQNYGNRVAATSDSFRAGGIETAIAAHDKAHEGVKPEDLDLLYFLERGELMRLRKDGLKPSTDAWFKATEKIQVWEEDSRSKLTKSAGELGAALLSESFNRYDGQDYEKVMLSTRLAQNHLMAGRWDDARIEIRRMYERETLIASLREKEVQALKDAAEEKGAKDTEVKLKDIKGYPVEIFDDPEVTGLRNAYQSAASHYLAGFVFEALNEPSLATAGYRQAIELRPDVPMLQKGLEGVATSKRVPAGKTDVLFVIESGSMPARETVKITLPVPIGAGVKLLSTSYPVIRPAKDTFIPTSIKVGDASVPAAMVTSLDAMARRALKDEMPGAVARSMVRMVVSGAAQEALQRNGGAFGSLMSLAVGLTSAATESADTRQWRTLPANISLARAVVPSGALPVSFTTPQGSFRQEVKVDGTYALVVLRPLGNSDLSALVSQPGAGLVAAAPAKPEPAKRNARRASTTVASKGAAKGQ